MMFGKTYEVGSKDYEKLMEEYSKLFKKYGYTVSKPDRESLLAEKDGQIGAFTIRDDGLCAGAFYSSFRKEDLMKGFEQEKKRCNRWNPRMGWFFYENMRNMQEGSGNHDLSMGELEWMLQRRCA